MEGDLKLYTQLHFNALIEDYRAREQETLKHIELTHQAFYVSVSIAGIFFAATPFIIEHKWSILYGVFPFFIYLSTLAQMRYMWTVAVHDRYLVKTLVPDLKNLLGSIPNNSAERYKNLMSWKTGYCANVYANKWHDLIIENSRLCFPMLIGILFFGIFISQYFDQLFLFNSHDLYVSVRFIIIILANLIFIIYVPLKARILYKFIKTTFHFKTPAERVSDSHEK